MRAIKVGSRVTHPTFALPGDVVDLLGDGEILVEFRGDERVSGSVSAFKIVRRNEIEEFMAAEECGEANDCDDFSDEFE